MGGVHAGGGEVFRLAMHQENERAATIGLAEIEFEGVRLREAVERQEFEITEILVLAQGWDQIVSVLIPCGGRQLRLATLDHAKRRERRIAGEILVGIHIESTGMIDRQQFDLVEINCFFHRLHEAEAQLAVF